MWPFDDLGTTMGGQLQQFGASLFEVAMRVLWEAGLAILREAFKLADQFSIFTVDTRTGPVSVLWPMMLWISGILALGLFFWQLTLTSLRGGRGFLRLVIGPVQYGIALAVTVGMVAAFLGATDGVTRGILEYGLQSQNFQEALTHTSFADGAVDGIKAVVLGICAVFGLIPAGIGFVLEMLFREAAIYVLVATIPITAAGLLARVSMGWYWIALRMIIVCCVMKPALALALVLGVAIAGGAQGLSGLLAGIGVLIIVLVVPLLLIRLFVFVDADSRPDGPFRDALAMTGTESYGSNSPGMRATSALATLYGFGGDEDGDAQESANTDRFDDATTGQGEDSDARPKDTANSANSDSGSGEPDGAGGSSSGSSTGSEDSRGSSAPSPPDPSPDADDGDADSSTDGGSGGREGSPHRPAAYHDPVGGESIDDAGFGGSAEASGGGAGGATGEQPAEVDEPALGDDGNAGDNGPSPVVPASHSDSDAGGGVEAAGGSDEPSPPEAPDVSAARPNTSDHGAADSAVPLAPNSDEPPGNADAGSTGNGGAEGESPQPPEAPESPEPGPGVDDPGGDRPPPQQRPGDQQ
ncbi:hypothetical protein REH65_32265 [Saccharopolyspora sp. ID03-671]|uniref:hypothetical protein n=1 Tax=Saccharopolyspora sp. ID03-671 TaxID=3073066 RepID=UPI003244649F